MSSYSHRAAVADHHAATFIAGLAVTGAALVPPLETATTSSLTAHMVQHVLLIAVAAPLLGAGLPRAGHHQRWAGWTAAALAVEAGVMWAWHAPGPYEAALRVEPLHALEHLSLLGTATVFWWALDVRRPAGGAVAFVFAAALPGSALGAAMTLAASPWYASYPSLADQQLAGVVMWAFAGLAYVVGGAVVFAVWLAQTERQVTIP